MSATPSIGAVPVLAAARDGRVAGLSLTLHNYIQTLFWTGAAILVCCLSYAIEKYGLIRWLEVLPNDAHYRMFKNPAELPMRLFGLPHFVIGTAFLLTSRRMRGPRSIVQLLGLAGLSVVFCALFWRYGQQFDAAGIPTGEPHPLALLVFYFYFLIHGFRDEAFFYKAYGDMPPDGAIAHGRIMVVLQLLMLGLLVSLALPAYVLYGQFRPEFRHPALDAMFPADWPYALRFAATFLPMLAVAVFAVSRIARKFEGGLRGLWAAHSPILTIFAISMGIILVALVSGPWTFNFVVLMHFVGWYLFGRASMRKRPPATAPTGWWHWMRTTEKGFTVMHLGLAAIVTILVALSVYGFGKTGVLDAVLGSKTFYYWTIVHVTLSFFPRG
jgi:hypothetical protein